MLSRLFLPLFLLLFSSLFAGNDTQVNPNSNRHYLESTDTNLTQNDTLLANTISVEHNGTVYNCSQEDLIGEDMNGTKVFHCPTEAEKRILDNSDERGTNEIDWLVKEVEAKTTEEKGVMLVESTDANASKKWHPFYYTKEAKKHTIPIKLYLSIRAAGLYEDDDYSFVDNGTRAGIFFYKKLGDDYEFVFQYETAIRITNKRENSGTDAETEADDLSLFLSPRLSYVALRKDDLTFAYGKVWSVYYDIAGMTDKFMVFGAQGAGAFNAGTDGAGSGTGRAADTLQLRIKRADYNLGLQVQHHPNRYHLTYQGAYEYATGASFYYKGLDNGVKIGATANYAHIADGAAHDNNGTVIKDIHHDIALLAGLSYQKDSISVNYTVGLSKNHITDDLGLPLSTLGSEFYLRYRWRKNWRFALGFNNVFPSRREYTGQYKLIDHLYSAQYAFNKEYTSLVFIEAKHAIGTNNDGSAMGNAVAVGFKYLLDY